MRRVLLIHDQIHESHYFVFGRGNGQHGLPVLSAIVSAVNGAAAIGRVQLSESRHPNAIGVLGIDDHTPNVMARFESGMPPSGPVVVTEVYPIAGV